MLMRLLLPAVHSQAQRGPEGFSVLHTTCTYRARACEHSPEYRSLCVDSTKHPFKVKGVNLFNKHFLNTFSVPIPVLKKASLSLKGDSNRGGREL